MPLIYLGLPRANRFGCLVIVIFIYLELKLATFHVHCDLNPHPAIQFINKIDIT